MGIRNHGYLKRGTGGVLDPTPPQPMGQEFGSDHLEPEPAGPVVFLWQGSLHVRQIREHLKNKNPEKTENDKSKFFLHILGFSGRNPFPEVPQSSCIFWDAQHPFSRRFFFPTTFMFWVSFSSSLQVARQNNTKMIFPGGSCHQKRWL